MNKEFSEYIVYVDESGDHSLEVVYEDHPVFVLAFCIFKKQDYSQIISPAICSLKFDFWGHDSVVFHSHKIRKQVGEFSILGNLNSMENFMSRLNDFMNLAPFTIISTVIDKRILKDRYANSRNPYHLSLLFCLERTSRFLEEREQYLPLTHLVMEARGKKEDAELELEFRRIMANASANRFANFDIQFADKRINSAGLQTADLVAHPIGRHYIKPDQENRSFEILEKKFYRYPNHNGKGLKIFPKSLESEKPRETRGIIAG